MRRRKNDVEDFFQGIFAVLVFVIMGTVLSPLLMSSMDGFLVFLIIIIFYGSILLILIGLVLKFLEIVGLKH